MRFGGGGFGWLGLGFLDGLNPVVSQHSPAWLMGCNREVSDNTMALSHVIWQLPRNV